MKKKKRRGPVADIERQRMLRFPGKSKENAERYMRGEPMTGPRIYTMHRSWDVFGTLRGGYEKHFESPEAAIRWWLDNADKYCNELYESYLDDLQRTSGHGHPGHRTNYFHEMMFAVQFPNDEEELLLLEAHSLWYPLERQHYVEECKLLNKVATIPAVKPCLQHANRWPIDFGDTSMLHVINGKITPHGFDACEAVMGIWKRRGMNVADTNKDQNPQGGKS